MSGVVKGGAEGVAGVDFLFFPLPLALIDVSAIF